MDIIIDRQTLSLLWSALKAVPKVSKQAKAKFYFEKIVRQGWASKYEVTEVIYILDSRLDDSGFDIYNFSLILGFKWQTIFKRPRSRSSGVAGAQSIRAMDLAALLIWLEQIGFECDPTSLTDLLLPEITTRGKRLFTNSELEIFWFKKLRHKKEAIRFLLKKDDIEWLDSRVIEKYTTKLGYKLLLKGTDTGGLTGLKVSSPKFRKQNAVIPTVCPDCGLLWSKGDPDSSHYHRQEHKRRIIYMDPRPNQQFLIARQEESEPELVTMTSPAWKHKEIYSRAVAFKHEFHFDFIQWQSPEGTNDKNAQGFLFGDNSGAIVGACSFRNIMNVHDERWILDWIWICPKERRSGHLAKRWKDFRLRFGDFYVTPPVSDAMKTFLAKCGDLKLLDN